MALRAEIFDFFLKICYNIYRKLKGDTSSMNKHEVFSHFSSILNNMLDTSLFFETFWQSPYSADDFYGSYDDEALPENLNIRFGATRGCIIDDYYDYVVKFDVEEDIYGSACEREESLYASEERKNLNQYFAECVYLGTYTKTIRFYDYYDIERYMSWSGYDWREFEQDFMNNEDYFGEIHDITISIPLYAYPKAEPHRPMGIAGTYDDNEYVNKAQKIYSPMRTENLIVAVDFIRQYGEEEYQRISDFLIAEDVNDLHQNNLGDVDGHYMILDYSGYHDGYSDDSNY